MNTVALWQRLSVEPRSVSSPLMLKLDLFPGSMVDVVFALTNSKHALRILNRLERCDLDLLGTPLRLEDLEGYAFVHDHSSIPSAGLGTAKALSG